MSQRVFSPLFFRLILSLMTAIIIIVGARLLVRAGWEIPNYLELEQQADLRDISRVNNAIDSRIEHLSNSYLPYSAWTELRNFAENPNSDFLSTYFPEDDWSTAYTSAFYVLNSERKVIWRYQSPELLQDAKRNQLSAEDLDRIAEQHAALSNESVDDGIAGGVSGELSSPVTFISMPVYDDFFQGPIGGYIVAWDYLQSQTLEYLHDILQTSFAFRPIQAGESIAHLYGKTPVRNSNNVISWILEDYQKRPVYEVNLFVDQRHFSDKLLDPATIIELVAALITLTVLAVALSWRFITPIRALKRSMNDIRTTQKYDHRINSNLNDEFGDLSREYDALLDHIQRQESALVASNHELLQLSNMDSLTGIANRRAFDTFLSESREHLPLSLLMIDIDFFKRYNDHYGHPQGDATLKAVAKALHRNCHSSTDLVARYGGEEFAIVMTRTHGLGARLVAERLIYAVSQLNLEHVESPHKAVTVSIGCYSCTDRQEAQDIIQRADEALYRAKQQGRNQVVLYADENAEEDARENAESTVNEASGSEPKIN